MKKVLIATAALSLMCGSAFAQSSQGNAGPDTKPGMTKSSTEKGSMNKGTTGMSNNGRTKGAVQPDASGQGGSGPGSDQGGTRVAPGNMK
jgi:hypothetical protein